jgi:hypothetical protein
MATQIVVAAAAGPLLQRQGRHRKIDELGFGTAIDHAITLLTFSEQFGADELRGDEMKCARSSADIAAQGLRGSAITTIQQFLDGSDAGGFCFGWRPGREPGHLGEFGDRGWPVLLSEVADFKDDLWPTIWIATNAFDERPADGDAC